MLGSVCLLCLVYVVFAFHSRTSGMDAGPAAAVRALTAGLPCRTSALLNQDAVHQMMQVEFRPTRWVSKESRFVPELSQAEYIARMQSTTESAMKELKSQRLPRNRAFLRIQKLGFLIAVVLTCCSGLACCWKINNGRSRQVLSLVQILEAPRFR